MTIKHILKLNIRGTDFIDAHIGDTFHQHALTESEFLTDLTIRHEEGPFEITQMAQCQVPSDSYIYLYRVGGPRDVIYYMVNHQSTFDLEGNVLEYYDILYAQNDIQALHEFAGNCLPYTI